MYFICHCYIPVDILRDMLKSDQALEFTDQEAEKAFWSYYSTLQTSQNDTQKEVYKKFLLNAFTPVESE